MLKDTFVHPLATMKRADTLTQRSATGMSACHACGDPVHELAYLCPRCGAMQDSPRADDGNSRLIASVLALLFGGLGLHKFYLGAWGWGLVYLMLCWTLLPSLVALVEGIRYLLLSETDFRCKAGQVRGPFALLW